MNSLLKCGGIAHTIFCDGQTGRKQCVSQRRQGDIIYAKLIKS